MASTDPLQKLDAINMMLGGIFEAPVNSLDPAGSSDVATALRMLDAKIREVLLKGLANNVERNVTLTPDSGTLKVPLPVNTLFVDNESSEDLDVVQRGRYLYDRGNHTFSFARPVICKVVYSLEWDDLPEHIKVPIAILAARRFQNHILGSDKGGFDKQDELEAMAQLGASDDDAGDYNVLTDNYTIASILDR